MTEPRDQLNYVLQHYWDGVSLRDTAWQGKAEEFEAKFVDYFALLSNQDPVSIDLLLAPLQRLDGNLLLEALGIYRRCYYDEASPLQDDELFRYVVIWAISSPKVPKPHQDAARELLVGLNRNRVGQKATNFTYSNDSTDLQLFPLESKYLLLLFGTPDCISCRQAQAYIARQPIYERLINTGDLRVLTIYLQHGGEPPLLKADTLLPSWIEQGYDRRDSILNHRLYDIKSSPTLYLIGQGGEVLLRDPRLDKLTKYLEENHEIQ